MSDAQAAFVTSQSFRDGAAQLRSLLREPRVSPERIAQLLDGFGHGERVSAIRTLGRGAQKSLWDAVEGFRPLALEDIVPATVPVEREVRHFGKNSLPLFTHFEKRFCRLEAYDASGTPELCGYNYQQSAMAVSFSGPGYFVATADTARAEVVIDYRRIPTRCPQGWPALRSNERGGASLVYGDMVDTLRRVSEHVTVGHANKGGKDMSAWFVLCREA